MELSSPRRVAVDQRGELWISDGDRVIGPGVRLDGFAEPRGLALDGTASRLWVADDGVVEVDLATGARRGAAELGGAVDVAVDEYDGWLYVAAPDGLWRAPLGGGELTRIAGVDDARGVALSADRRRVYATAGATVLTVDLATGDRAALVELGAPGALAITPMGLAVADPARHAIYGVNTRHARATELWTADLLAPDGVAFHRITRDYVIADTGNRRIARLTRDRALVPVELSLYPPG